MDSAEDTTFTDLQLRIIEGAIKVINQKGLKYTMDDVARALHMSKKTIYKAFSSKEDLLIALADYVFGYVEKSMRKVREDPTLTTREKIDKALRVPPEAYQKVDLRHLNELRDKYPAVYEHVEARIQISTGLGHSVIEQGIKEGVIRPVSLPVTKFLYDAALTQFFKSEVLVENGITYTQAIDEVASIIMDGIAAPDADASTSSS